MTARAASEASRNRRKQVGRRVGLSVEALEDRLTPALTSFSGGVLTIDYDYDPGIVNEAVTVTNAAGGIALSGTTFSGDGSGPFAGVDRIEITDTANRGGQSLTFAGTSFVLSGGLNVSGPETIAVHAAIDTAGEAIFLLSNGDIALNKPLVSGGGGISLVADSDANGSGMLTIAQLPVELVDPNPAAGNGFGTHIVPLPNGNIVVTSPFDDFAATDAGAVYLFDGTTGSLISALRGSAFDDRVGIDGATALTNGNFVVASSVWGNPDGGLPFAGAVTWGSGKTGVSGFVSAGNSLVGSTAFSNVGAGGVSALSNGNYVVNSPYWRSGGFVTVGAVTWGNGVTGISGAVSAVNSLVGSVHEDFVGEGGVTVLANGNYVVRSSNWDNGAIENAGAVTWGNGAVGISGLVSDANSLVGSSMGDFVGFHGVTALPNGNYVVRSSVWDNGAIASAGAVTWGNGATGISGVISDANSLVGSSDFDYVGNEGVTVLTNGNYVVSNSSWDNGAIANAGAVTWGNGATGISGVVSVANSLVGSSVNDNFGLSSVTALTNGNYVARSPFWDNGAIANAGAVTWGNGSTGISGYVSAGNSLVGSTANDSVGIAGLTALSNGNYVVVSYFWDGAAEDVGAVTWANGATGISGFVTADNSLVGSTANDNVGNSGVRILANGNYVVRSTIWDNGAAVNAGAATWGSGTTGISGPISAANSLVGSGEDNSVGSGDVTALANGNYVVVSPYWSNGIAADVGAATWGNGTTGAVGVVGAANSLVGSTANDNVGLGGVTALNNGNYVVSSAFWDNVDAPNGGAATWGSGTTGVAGIVSAANSLVGSGSNDRISLGGVTALTNGNYVVGSYAWSGNVGAVTWGSGATGIKGEVSTSNSLTTTSIAAVGGVVTALANGNYVVSTPAYGPGNSLGAATWGNGRSGTSGLISAANSLVGASANAGLSSVTVAESANLFIARFSTEGGGRIRVGSDVGGIDTVAAGSGTIGLLAADVALGGSVASSTSVSIRPSQAGGTIDLGTNAPDSLGLTDAELDRVTAPTLTIGGALAGAVAVTQPISSANTLSIVSGAAITVDASVQLAAGKNLSLSGASIVVNEELETAGGALSLSAKGDITLLASINSGGGAIGLHADSDANGVGGLILSARTFTSYTQQQQITAAEGAAGDTFG